MTRQPLELAHEIEEELRDFLFSVSKVTEYDRFKFARIIQNCERLASTDVVSASLIKALLYSTVGEFDDFDHWVKNAILNNGESKANAVLFMHYVNHGFASKAHDLIKPLIDSRGELRLMEIATGMFSIGAFHSVLKAVEEAQENNFVLKMNDTLRKSKEVALIMNELNINESEIAKLLDCAGLVIRENKLLWNSNSPKIRTLSKDNQGPAISIDWLVNITPQHASQMNWALSEKIAQNDAFLNGVSVSFLGRKN